ncbi:MAG: hypothetical protein ACYTF8_00150 [Planctomycetota bacterium]
MRRSTMGLGVLGVGLLTLAVSAEKADMPRAGLLKKATHVVVGKVTAVYARKSTEGRWRYTRHVAEVKIDSVEKGDGLKAGDLAYVRYWRRAWMGNKPPTSTSGHRGLPTEGETLRIYLARNAHDGFWENDDGGFNVIGANGFERLKKEGG